MKAEAPSARQGVTVWFTGLPCAGKTTASRAVASQLSAYGLPVELLDADALRLTISRGLGFSKEDRDENVRRIGFVCGLLARHGVVVLVSAIAPYREVRAEIRARLGRFVEVYVNAPLAVCEKRDVKGLYRHARSGELHGLTGVDAPYEPPESPDVECRTDIETVEQSAAKVVAFLRENYAGLFLR
jgi:adenylylsulfate kinase